MRASSVLASQALADRVIAASYAGMRVGSFSVETSTGDLNLMIRCEDTGRSVRF